MISQIPQSTEAQLLNFVLGGAGLLGLVYLVLNVWHKWRELFKQGKAEQVQFTCLEHSLEKLELRLTRLEDKVEMSWKQLHYQHEQQHADLNEKVSEVNQTVQRILGRLEKQ